MNRSRRITTPETLGVIPDDVRTPTIRRVIARIVDGAGWTNSARSTARRSSPASRASGAFPSPSLPTTASCSAKARRGGTLHRAGVQARHPAVFLQNISGFMVGSKCESRRHRQDGAKMVTAVASASAKVHRADRRLVQRNNYNMCGRACSRRVFRSPGPTSVMGGRQATSVLTPEVETTAWKRGRRPGRKPKKKIQDQY